MKYPQVEIENRVMDSPAFNDLTFSARSLLIAKVSRFFGSGDLISSIFCGQRIFFRVRRQSRY